MSWEGWGHASCQWYCLFDVDLAPLFPSSCPGPENTAWSSFPSPTLTIHPASFAHMLWVPLMPSLHLPSSFCPLGTIAATRPSLSLSYLEGALPFFPL